GDADDRVWQALLSDVQRSIGLERSAPANLPALATVAAHAGPARETLLAVLAFDNLSSDAEMQYFSDGVSEDILGRIQRGSKLKVIGRTSSFQFRGADKAKAAAALKATHVLDGSIRRGGAKVRITASLTDVASQTSIWSDKYDRSLDDIFAVQDEISEAIAAALDSAFFPAEQAAIDPAAYDLYLRGKQADADLQRNLHNLEMLQAAVRIVPDFADAWAMLGVKQFLLLMNTPWRERAAVRAQVEVSVQRALARDPDNPTAAWVQSSMLAPFSDFLAHERAIQRLEQIGQNSSDALASLGYLFACVGRVRDATAVARRAVALDPLDRYAISNAAIFLWQSGEYEAGLAALTDAVEQDPDNQHNAVVLILAHAHARNWSDVARLIDPARLAQYPLREYGEAIGLALALEKPHAEQAQQQLQASAWEADRSGHIDCAALLWLAELSSADETYALADRCRLDPSGSPNDRLGVTAYRTNNLFFAGFAKLRADPRFVKLCARLGLVEYWLATQKWPDCADTVPYDFRAECEKYRDYPKDVFLA
ncbi:MAG: hypothetical protein KGQ52_05565, partial [Alphaproteobacteria bacterium]|nr:hypothetical protein [Alphaproteobacteria bacterium]